MMLRISSASDMTVVMTIMMTMTAWTTARTVVERRRALPLTTGVTLVRTFANPS
jgi:uncharacterized membrane protein (DUF4010 family)